MSRLNVSSIVEIKERLKEMGCYDTVSFDMWFSTPIPRFDYTSPREMFESGDLLSLAEAIEWMGDGSHGSC